MKEFLASADSMAMAFCKEEFKNGIVKLGVSDEDAATVVDEVWFVDDQYFIFQYVQLVIRINCQCFNEIDKDTSGSLSIQELVAWLDSDGCIPL